MNFTRYTAPVLNSLLTKRITLCSSSKVLSTDTSYIKIGVCYQELSSVWFNSTTGTLATAYVNIPVAQLANTISRNKTMRIFCLQCSRSCRSSSPGEVVWVHISQKKTYRYKQWICDGKWNWKTETETEILTIRELAMLQYKFSSLYILSSQ